MEIDGLCPGASFPSGACQTGGGSIYQSPMKLTVEIADDVMADLRRILRVKTNDEAVAVAVAEFVRCEKARDFALLLRKGEFDYPATNAEMEKLQG
jgi:Arc/MetJ family transcription regulator